MYITPTDPQGFGAGITYQIVMSILGGGGNH